MTKQSPNYVPDTLNANIEQVRFTDARIPNFLYVHPATINNDQDRKIRAVTNAKIYETATQCHKDELAKLKQARDSGRINTTIYQICTYLYQHVTNEFADTSLANNGYFFDMHAITDYAINTDNQIATQVLYRYIYLADVIQLDVYANHNSRVYSDTRKNIRDSIQDILKQPAEVDLKLLRINTLPIEWQNGINIHETQYKDGNPYAIYRRLHNFNQCMEKSHKNDDNIFIKSLHNEYHQSMLEDIANVQHQEHNKFLTR